MAAMKAAKHQKVLYPFTPKTRLYDLIKAEYHTTLAEWLELIGPYLKGGCVPNWKTCRCLDFVCRSEKIVWCIAILLVKLDGNGLKYKRSVFFRYLSTHEHSNIPYNEGQLKTLVNSYIRCGLPPIV